MKEEDFIEMTWRIDLLAKEQGCFDKFPELEQRFDGFMLRDITMFQSITNDQLVRYIVYSYHKKSPFVKRITDVKQRKQQALIQAGFDFAGGIPEDINDLLECRHEKVADMTLRFLMGENSMKFSALMMRMDAYYRYNYKLAYGENVNIKSITDALREMEESIESLSHEVFSGDIGLADFAAGAKIRGLTLTPEDHAHKNKK